MTKQYWLIKSEPDTYSIDDMERDQRECWEGVRNYQARNFMRDTMNIGDLALFYHSNAKPPGVVGIVKVVSEPYPDHTAFDPDDKYFDPKSSKENPRWLMRDFEFVEKFSRLISLSELKEYTELKDMLLLKKGMRLSIQPVTEKEFTFIHELADSFSSKIKSAIN